MSYIANPEAPSGPTVWKRFRVPIVVLTFACPIVALPFVWSSLRLPEEAVLAMNQIAWLTVVGSLLILSIWWLFFSSFRWFIVFPVAFFVAGGAAAAVYAMRNFELTANDSGLVPRFRWAWTPSAVDKLNSHLDVEKAKPKSDLPAIDANIGPEDFPAYRGKHRDGIVKFAILDPDWETNAPQVLWRQPCPGGYGGVAVAGNIAVTLQQRDAEEVVVCYDRATGRQRWTFPYPANYKDVMGDGPRSTPTIHDGRIFTLGATGEFVCVNVKGEKQWTKNILTEAKAKNVKWGLTGSPLIVDDLVIAHAGIDPENPENSALIAYDQKTGEKRWAAGNRRAAYSSPQLATLAGHQQILLFDGNGLAGIDPKNGSQLWSVPWDTKFDMNMMQPLVIDKDRVFISAEASEGCALYKIVPPNRSSKTWNVESVWHTKSLGARFANPVTDGKSIYGLHGLPGELRCVDLADGKLKWKGDRHGPGQMLLTRDALLVVSDKGVVTLHALDTAENQELARYKVFNDKTWNTPALAGDLLFLRNQDEIAVLKLLRR